MAKKTKPARKSRPARKPARRTKNIPFPMPSPGESFSRSLDSIIEQAKQLGRLEARDGRVPDTSRFISLDSPEPGQVHIRADAIEVISHPVQRQAGGEWTLFVTLASSQKAMILDTAENRTALGIPLQPHDVGTATAPPRSKSSGVSPGWKPPYNPAAPRLRKPATLAAPPAPNPNAEPQVRDENEDNHE